MGKLLYESNILHITSYFYQEVIYYSYILLHQKSNFVISGAPIKKLTDVPITDILAVVILPIPILSNILFHVLVILKMI